MTIEKFNYIDETIFFFICFRDVISREEWTYKTRYSLLKKFHQTLLDNHLKGYLKKFPSRKIFGITNENPEYIEKRRKQLEEYLDHALA